MTVASGKLPNKITSGCVPVYNSLNEIKNSFVRQTENTIFNKGNNNNIPFFIDREKNTTFLFTIIYGLLIGQIS